MFCYRKGQGRIVVSNRIEQTQGPQVRVQIGTNVSIVTKNAILRVNARQKGNDIGNHHPIPK